MLFIFIGLILSKEKPHQRELENYIKEASTWLSIMNDMPDETLDKMAQFVNKFLLFYQKLKQDHSDRLIIDAVEKMKKIEKFNNDNQYEYFLQAVGSLMRRTESAIDQDQKEDNQDDKKANKTKKK